MQVVGILLLIALKMELRIVQNYPSFFETKYFVSCDGREMFFAKKVGFQLPLKPKIGLFDSGKNQIFTITKHSPILVEFDITFANGEIAEFRTQNLISQHYTLHFQNQEYSIKGHKGRLYSIFRKEMQIAWFEWDKLESYYTILADNDANKEILIGIVLVLEIRFKYDDRRFYDYGNQGNSLATFDQLWKPNMKMRNK